MYFEITGSGKNLLLIHGLSANRNMFYHQINFLKKDFRCISIDLPGFGNSKDEKIPESIEKISEAIFRLLEKLEISNISVLGYSLGGTIALNMFKKKPEILNCVIASNSLYNWYSSLYHKLIFSIFNISMMSEFSREKLRKVYGKLEYKSLKKRELEKMMDIFRDAPTKSIKKYLNIIKRFDDEDTFPEQGKILFLAGGKDKIAPLSKIKKLHKKNSGSSLKVIKNGDHAMCVSFRKEYNRIVEDFLLKF